ncbi:MAG: hypothetical protein QOD99_378 [Chthoniobacter sp.]|jgi:hypothetical protein|nr:hypothetical protein [Chthoniobacter sp.]
MGALCLWLMAGQSLLAVDWPAVQRTAGEATVVNMKAEPLVEGGYWSKVPKKFLELKAQIFSDEHGKKTNGVADLTVTKEGWIFVACDYGYEGNQQGGWMDERWEEKDFKKRGWSVLGKAEGALVDKGNREWVVFAKHLKAGETLRLRANKYNAPHVILVTGEYSPFSPKP